MCVWIINYGQNMIIIIFRFINMIPPVQLFYFRRGRLFLVSARINSIALWKSCLTSYSTVLRKQRLKDKYMWLLFIDIWARMCINFPRERSILFEEECFYSCWMQSPCPQHAIAQFKSPTRMTYCSTILSFLARRKVELREFKLRVTHSFC